MKVHLEIMYAEWIIISNHFKFLFKKTKKQHWDQKNSIGSLMNLLYFSLSAEKLQRHSIPTDLFA